MSRFRMWFISGVLLFIVAGHLFDAWKRRDHWPFAAYPMFAGVNRATPITSEQLVGVTADGREIPVTSQMIGVLHMNRVRPSLVRIHNLSREPDSDDPRGAEKALDGLLEMYEARRTRGEHAGPPLVGMRFYRLRWEFMWRAENAATPEKSLLFQSTDAPATAPATAPAATPVAAGKVVS